MNVDLNIFTKAAFKFFDEKKTKKKTEYYKKRESGLKKTNQIGEIEYCIYFS